jgi:phosphoglycolate phosphatase
MTDDSPPIASFIEIANPYAPRGSFRSALFDFDGTLSLIREGWQNVMIPYFLEELRACPDCESQEEVERVVREFVETLTGKQTIYQCFQLAEEVTKRGGTAHEPLEYKHEYLRRLWERIEHRVEGLKSGAIQPDDLLLRGSRAFLQALQDRGITLYLASGTDLVYVKDEAAALKVDGFFGRHIYGALDEYRDFSKQMIIDRILRENDLKGPELLVVGDGYVEIENGKGVGGYALGVASDEANPGGLDAWKRTRLLTAGADAIVRDFADTAGLMAYLFSARPD